VTLLGQGVGLGDPQRAIPTLPCWDSGILLGTCSSCRHLNAFSKGSYGEARLLHSSDMENKRVRPQTCSQAEVSSPVPWPAVSPRAVSGYMQGGSLTTGSGSGNTEADFPPLVWEFQKALTDRGVPKPFLNCLPIYLSL